MFCRYSYYALAYLFSRLAFLSLAVFSCLSCMLVFLCKGRFSLLVLYVETLSTNILGCPVWAVHVYIYLRTFLHFSRTVDKLNELISFSARKLYILKTGMLMSPALN